MHLVFSNINAKILTQTIYILDEIIQVGLGSKGQVNFIYKSQTAKTDQNAKRIKYTILHISNGHFGHSVSPRPDQSRWPCPPLLQTSLP